MGLTQEQEEELRATLKRCSPETVEAAVAFRKKKHLNDLELVVRGIIERYAEDKEKFASAPEDAKLIEDLGFDSLTIMEIVVTIEEVTGIRIDNDEVQGVKSLSDVKTFVAAKLGLQPLSNKANAAKASQKKYDKDALMLILPQSHPFMFMDDAAIDGDHVKAFYQITGEEYFLEGHFKDNPVFPASIVFEALGQAGCLWILEKASDKLEEPLSSQDVLFAALEGAHFHSKALPGDKLELDLKLISLRDPLAVFSGTVQSGARKVATVERLMLAFGAGAAAHLAGSLHHS